MILIAPVALLVLLAVGFVVFATSQPSLGSDSSALARISMPLGGGKVVSVRATGPNGRAIPVTLSAGRIIPKLKLKPGERVSIVAVVERPGWIGWLAGSRDTKTLSLRTPTTSLEHQYLTLAPGAPIRLSFSNPVSTYAYGQPGALQQRTLAQPQTGVTIPRPSPAGTLTVAASPRPWEKASATTVAWFPAGAASSAVVSPAPGTQISSATPITLTFSKPYSDILGGAMPKLSSNPPGQWSPLNSHTVIFKPSGYGYGLDTSVNVQLPNGVQIVGAHSGAASSVSWTVPSASSLRLNQILAQLGYLPYRWQPAGNPVALTPVAQLAAAIKPPAGSFSLIWGNTPSSLQAQWNPDQQAVVSQGALMAFEQDQGMYGTNPTPAQVWHALIAAAIKGQRSTFGYTYAMVSLGSQSLSVWHSGRTVLSTAVNTGIASAPTATGTYPVFEHITSGTMSGTNPDGSHYSDPGIPWISYFNGGDALHGFIRASYGSPQSLGCVEMPYETAGRVYPYTPIGTLVNVA